MNCDNIEKILKPFTTTSLYNPLASVRCPPQAEARLGIELPRRTRLALDLRLGARDLVPHTPNLDLSLLARTGACAPRGCLARGARHPTGLTHGLV